MLKHLTLSLTQPIQTLGIALEDMENGQKAIEKEYVWYGQLADPSQLLKALSKEEQYQSSVRGKNGSVRVRKTVKDGAVRYTLTAKAFLPGNNNGCEEVSQATTQDMYAVFRMLSGESMDKTRYSFDAGDGFTWEVDVFVDNQGNPKNWVKIDLEDNGSRLKEFPPLPITLNNVIFSRDKQYNAKDKAQLDELYRNVFVNKV